MKKNEKESKKIIKKMDKEKMKKSPKENISNAFKSFKEYCIKDTSRTILLVAILIAIYVVLNLWLRTINLAQIDLTKDKQHTLTDQSKNIAKTIDTEMKFYVWKYTEDSAVVDLLKQYNSENSKISYEIVETDDVELKKKYGFEDNYPAIIGEAENGKTSYINDSELYTMDDNYNMVDLTEQKLTNAINNLSSIEPTKVYFIQGRTNYTTDMQGGLYYLSYLLQNEYYEVDSIDIVSDPTIPEDCDVLAIMGLAADLTEAEADSICAYIEKGGDMIITNDIDYSNVDRNYPNFQRVLDEYSITMPNKVVQESSKNAVAGYSNIVIQANLAQDHEITRLMYNNSVKPILCASGNIELDTSKMSEKNCTANPILTTSEEATLANLSTKQVEPNDNGEYYVLGTAIQKTVESGEESRAVVFASTVSFSDEQVDGQNPIVAYNANIILNSFAFASNQGELYSIRKTTSYTQYEPTERQDKIVRIVIIAVPVSVALFGLGVWFSRRRLK